MQLVARRTFELVMAPLAGLSGPLAVRIEDGWHFHELDDTLPQ